MVLVDSPAVDGPAVLPVDVADDTDGAAEAPLLPLPEVPPESGSPSTLRNPAAERQLSPSRFRLTQRAAEAGASQSEVGEEEGEVGEDERQEGEGAGDAEEVVAPPSPSKVKRFSQLPQLSQSGGLPKWNQFYTAESVNQRVQLMRHPKVKHNPKPKRKPKRKPKPKPNLSLTRSSTRSTSCGARQTSTRRTR